MTGGGGGGASTLRSTEGAVRGPQYDPRPSIQPEKRSFEGSFE